MTNSEPNVDLQGRYSTAETCRILQISRNTLHKYTELGRIKAGVHRSTAKRYYMGAEILQFWAGLK
jgi:predicted site-specific integrase-resolvase